MNRLARYIALSAALHLLLLLLGPPLLRQKPNRPAPPIVMEFLPPAPPAPVHPVANPPPVPEAQPAPPQAPAPALIPPEPPAEAQPPPRSVMYEKRPTLEESLGMASGPAPPAPPPQDLEALMNERLRRWTARPSRGRRPPGGLLLPLAAASEGAAFYAAYRADNLPAMVAVVGVSLTAGALRQGVNHLAYRLTHRDWTPEDLQDLTGRDLDILERLWARGPLDARSLYLGLPEGWTYHDLRGNLDALVKCNILHRKGRGPEAVYTAAVEREQVLRALLAASPAPTPEILRLARADLLHRKEAD